MRWRIKGETWNKVMSEAMYEAEKLAKQLCPVDTGKMRNSIQVRQTGNFSYELSVGVKYASFNEFGWYGISGKIGNIESPIFYKGGFRPFVRPSIWLMNKKYKEYIKSIIFSGHYY